MNYFDYTKPLIHRLPAEMAHRAAVRAVARGLIPAQPTVRDEVLKTQVAGIDFPNPVGLAAGFDKDAETLDHIFEQGFGFVECGTVTPLPQPGNPKPRLFRLPKEKAVINRLGFNNSGLTLFAANLAQYEGKGIIGANIGKNKDSADAISDYVAGLNAVYDHADYITVNISSPNTAGLRDLQARESLGALIGALHTVRDEIVASGLTRKPIFVKIAPDLSRGQAEAIAEVALSARLDGLVVSNTTIGRPALVGYTEEMREGGLSGKPLMNLSTQMLRDIYRLTEGRIPLIGVGGILSAADAYAKITAGASLVQVYTGLVYEGFCLVTRINKGLLALLRRDGFTRLSDAVGSGIRIEPLKQL